MLRSSVVVSVLVLLPCAAMAQANPPALPEHAIPRAAGPIAVDGRLDEPSWAGAEPVAPFVFPWWKEGEKEPTEARLLWDDTNLYVSFVASDKHVSAELVERDDPVSNEDCVEVFTAPNIERIEDYFNFEINALGTLLDRAPADRDWNSEGIEIAIRINGTINDESDTDQSWTTEIAIPFANFAGVAPNLPPKDGDAWRLNLYRCGGKVNPQYSAWSPPQTVGPNFHAPEFFGIVRFSAEPATPEAPGALSREQVIAAMKKASGFMLDRVSNRGGFVEKYTEDLSEQWGEVPARRSMSWVQSPGTVSVGRVLLEAYQATGDEEFLRYSERCANALVWGQHPSGGWHYFFDYDPAGIPQWYEEVATKCWGWEEYYHYYGNCTFDDDVTTGATDFLLDVYMTSLDPRYRIPLLKAIDFILESQYPEGGWPQRYPPPDLRGYGVETDAHYTLFHTYNDGVIAGNIYFLLKAARLLGNDQYRRAAVRGMHFVVISQLGTPQAGWSQQHDMDLNPAGARSFEPRSVAPNTTEANIGHLMRFYKITGDRRYLRGIPDAIEWLENSNLPPGHSDQGHTHAQFVEIGTNKPLYAHREGTSREDGRYWVDYEPGNFPGHYGMQARVDLEGLKREYARVFALTPEAAMAEYAAERDATPVVQNPGTEKVVEIIGAMDERGAWVEDLSVPDYTDWKFRPRRQFRGFSTRTYTSNMKTMIGFLEASAE